MKNGNSLRVKNHRARMNGEGYRRLEVTLGGGMIERSREVAQMRGWPLWRVVEEALAAYVMPHDVNTGNSSPTGNAEKDN